MINIILKWWADYKQAMYLWPRLRDGNINWVLRKERFAIAHYGEVDYVRQARLKKRIIGKRKKRRIRHRLRLHTHMYGQYYQ